MKKNWRGQLHVLVASFIFLAILILIYQIASRHNHRFDLTKDKTNSVSEETQEVLKRMSRNDIRVRAFFPEGDRGRRDLQMTLKEMATHHPHFNYEFYDPDRSPSEARRSRVDAYGTVIVEYENHEERFKGADEESLTNALLRLAHPETKTLCFTKGHGEAVLSDTERSGYSEWRRTLQDSRYQVNEIQIIGEGIPAECQALVMAGPHYELLPKEIEILHEYFGTGRGFLLLIDPMDPGVGASFHELLKPLGIKLGENVVVDKMSRMFGADYLIPLVSQYADHPIMQRFHAATFLPIARTITLLPQIPENVEVTELAKTNPGSWAETNLKNLENGEAEADAKTDVMGPVSLAVVAELKGGEHPSRFVVVGDSDFLTNAYLPLSGNKDFALNIIQWLARDDRWISIRVKVPRFEPLFLRKDQSVGVAVFSIGVLPLTALFAGSVGVWFRRRKTE